MPTYQYGDGFTVTWPPLVFNLPYEDSDNLGFAVDAEAARADGWEQDSAGNWVCKLSEEEARERDERDAELAKEYGELT